MRRKYPRAPIAAVGVIVRLDDQILLIQRGKDPSKGYWSFPGGAIELGETAQEAARREAREETGLELELMGVATIVDNVTRDDAGQVAYHYVIIDYFARPVSGALRAGSDVSDVRWVRYDDLDTLPVTEKAGRILQELLDTSDPAPNSA